MNLGEQSSVLKHMSTLGLHVDALPHRDIPLYPIKLLDSTIKFHTSVNLSDYYQNQSSILSLLEILSQSFFNPLKLQTPLEIILQMILDLLEKVEITKNITLLNKLIQEITQKSTYVFESSLIQENNTGPIVAIQNSVITFVQKLKGAKISQYFSDKTWECFFFICVGIIDYIISPMYYTIANKASVSHHLSSLLGLMSSIANPQNDLFTKTCTVWPMWSSNILFSLAWCTEFTSVTKDFLKDTFDSNIKSDKAYTLKSLSKLINISQIEDPTTFASSLKNLITAFTNSASKICKSKESLFVPLFPASLVGAFLVEKSLELVSTSKSFDLLTASMRLISILGYSRDQILLLDGTVQRTNELLTKLFNVSDSKLEGKKRDLLRSPLLFDYITTSNVGPRLITRIQRFIGGKKGGDLEDLYIALAYASVPKFRLSAEAQNNFFTRLAGNSEAAPALLWWYFVFGDGSVQPRFFRTLDTLDTNDSSILTATYITLAALPYSRGHERSRRFFQPGIIKKLIERMTPGPHSLALLVALTEIAAATGVSLAPVVENYKDKFASHLEMLSILSEARLRKLRFRHKPIEPKRTERFVAKGKVYSVIPRENSYTLIVRDEGGASVLSIEELMGENEREPPKLSTLPPGNDTNVTFRTIDLYGELPPSDFEIDNDLRMSDFEKPVEMDPFGETPQSNRRPPVFEVLRMLNFFEDPSLRILPRTQETDAFVEAIDEAAVISSVHTPVYYVCQGSTSITKDWDGDFVARFFHMFARKARKEDTYCVTTNTLRLNFVKHTSTHARNAPFALILNDTTMSLRKELLSVTPLAVSVTPLGGALFRLQVERNDNGVRLPFGPGPAPRVVVSAALLQAHIVLLALAAYAGRPEVFAARYNARKALLSRVPAGVAPAEYLVAYQNEI